MGLFMNKHIAYVNQWFQTMGFSGVLNKNPHGTPMKSLPDTKLVSPIYLGKLE